jgi:flotillin
MVYFAFLKANKEKQKIREEEIQIVVVERRKQIAVEEKEIERKEKELTATVKRPAEAESYKVQTLAKGQRYVRHCSQEGRLLL